MLKKKNAVAILITSWSNFRPMQWNSPGESIAQMKRNNRAKVMPRKKKKPRKDVIPNDLCLRTEDSERKRTNAEPGRIARLMTGTHITTPNSGGPGKLDGNDWEHCKQRKRSSEGSTDG
jgi:hypothetical protein